MKNPQFCFDDNAIKLLGWASRRLNPRLRRMAAEVGYDDSDLLQEAAIGLLQTPPPSHLKQSTAIMHATTWSAAHAVVPFQFQRRRGQSRTHPVGEFHDLRTEPEDLHAAAENRELAGIALRHLPRQERTLIELRFGLAGEGFERSHGEIAKIMRITKQRVGQLEKRAMGRLRKLPALQAAG